jgi:tRNA-dihydrouridine synthase 3
VHSKGPDFPGQCPFAAADECPYGLLCRWAGTHKVVHPIVKEYLEGLKKKEDDDEKMEVVKIAEEKMQQDNGVAETTAAATAEAGAEPVVEPASSFYNLDGTITSQPLVLEPSSTYAPTMNVLPNHIQVQFRKGQYDFSKSDAVLAKLGINNAAKSRDLKHGKGGKGGGREAGKLGQHQDGKATDQQDAGGDKPAGDDTELERSKRPRLDTEAEKPAADADFLDSLETKNEAPMAAATTAPTTAEPAAFYTETPLHPRERKTTIDFRGKTFLAPLTTVGNLPFRRLCKSLGADITCGEMAIATNLLQGQPSEWALLKKHPEEDCFGVQLCGGFGDSMVRCAQMVQENLHVDFIDINFGCPIDVVIQKGAGSACLLRPNRMKDIIQSMSSILNCPLTLKMRKGYTDKQDIAHLLLPKVAEWGAAAVTLHGRTREQRYSRLADWEYIKTCADVVKNIGNSSEVLGGEKITNTNIGNESGGGGGGENGSATASSGMQLIGNGDVMSFEDHERAITEAGVATTYVARGALIKPWIFQEIKERRHWDISATERLDLIKKFAVNGIEHWGSDTRGIENTRRFLLEWLSFAYRYAPVGLLEVLPQKTNQRPPAFVGRSDLETLLSSPDPRDWIYISEMVLGPAPPGFQFTPKHKGTSYAPGNSVAPSGGGSGGGSGGRRDNHHGRNKDRDEEF